jgi:D-alanine-D-alanine ligase
MANLARSRAEVSAMSRERVLVVYNEPTLPKGHANSESEIEVLENANAVAEVLRSEGYQTACVGVGRDPSVLIRAVHEESPDAVFNLFEGLPDHYATEAYVAGLLDWLGVPFTGCPCQALLLAQNKALTKRLFQSAGVPTAPFAVAEEVPGESPLPGWPLIVKPACQDSSVGIDQASVVTDLPALRERVALVLERFGRPALIEEFIAGR